MENKIKRRDTDGDIIRIAAAFFVVVIHSAATAPVSVWSIFLNSAARFSVPVFVMLSGRYMLSKRRDISETAWKAAVLIGIMILWSALYYAYEIFAGGRKYVGIADTAVYLLTEPVHLWYLYMTAALYLFTPIFYVFCENAEKRIMQYTLALTFILGSIVTMALRTPCAETLTVIVGKMHIDCSLGFVFCYLLGDYIRRYGISRRVRIYILSIAGIIITFSGTLYLSHSGELNDFLYSFFAPNVLAVSVGFYVFACNLKIKNKEKTPMFLRNAAMCSFGIYLVHPLVLDVFNKYIRINALSGAAPLTRALCAFAVSFLLVSIIRKIPFVRRIVM